MGQAVDQQPQQLAAHRIGGFTLVGAGPEQLASVLFWHPRHAAVQQQGRLVRDPHPFGS